MFLKKLNWIPLFILSQVPLPLMILIPEIRKQAKYDSLDYLIFFAAFGLLFFVTYFYARGLKIIPKFSKSYLDFKKIGIGFACLFVVSMIANSLASQLGTSETANQTDLNSLMASSPAIIFAICTISAGFFEELVFRVGIFELLSPKHPKIAALLAIAVFALMHGPTDLGSLLIYLSMSIVLTMLYYEYRNFYVNMSVHALWNTMVTLLTLLYIN
ncbi:type II CAAX endopeptidase family protein [Streptococcaceae bacterium ESL0687]|nr:type II CAAX endopeptidase family protein [Streptococcaceae bacterium ESL0687]